MTTRTPGSPPSPRRSLQRFLAGTVGPGLPWHLLGLGVLLLALIWITAWWEAQRIREDRLAAFRVNLQHVAQVLDGTVERQLESIDNALLILRAEYVDHRGDMRRTVALLQQGPLRGVEVHVTVIGRDGYPKFTDVPGSSSPVYLGDRAHFRVFADGGADELFISEPVLGRITKRWGLQLARPIWGRDGRFEGVVVVFLPPEQLTRVIQRLDIGADMIMTLTNRDGAVISRSRDLDKFRSNRMSEAQRAEYSRNRSGYALRRSALDQVERGIAYRWLENFPLLLVVSRTPDAVYAEIATIRRMLIGAAGGGSLFVLGALFLLGRAERQRARIGRELREVHDHLVEAQSLARLGSWDLDHMTGKLYWSDEVYRIFEMERTGTPASYETLLEAIHPDDRAAVQKTYAESLARRGPYESVHRLCLPDGRIKWVRELGESVYAPDGQALRSSGTVQDITERKLEEAQREALSRERMLLLESTGEGIYGIGLDGRCTFINQAAARMLGYSVDELIGRDLHKLVHYKRGDGSLFPVEQCSIYQAFSSGQAVQVDGDVFWRKDGQPLPVAYSAHPIRDADWITGTVVVFSDITERKRTEAEMRIAATAFETQEGMFITDENGVILRINSAFTTITGYTAEDIVGKNPRYRSSGRHDAAFYSAMWQRIRSTGAWKGEIWNRRKNGEIYPESVTITAVQGTDNQVTHYVATMHDISERKAAEEQIHNLAFYDALTHLPNRRLLLDRLQQAMLASMRSGHHGALLFIDLDKFKQLNDTLGHDAGDQLLQQVARRLQECVRQTDTVSRLGGDEFVVLLEELSPDAVSARHEAESVGQKILARLNLPYDLDGHLHLSTPSVGATLFSGQRYDRDELLKQADLAMYRAKSAGRNTLHFFEATMLPEPRDAPAG